MTWGTLAALAAVVGVPLTFVGIWYTARQQAREQAAKREQERQATYNKGFEDGQHEAAPTLALLRSQRDDARRERDNERSDRVAAEHQVQQLESELRQVQRERGM